MCLRLDTYAPMNAVRMFRIILYSTPKDPS
jgi:hypothetical protein